MRDPPPGSADRDAHLEAVCGVLPVMRRAVMPPQASAAASHHTSSESGWPFELAGGTPGVSTLTSWIALTRWAVLALDAARASERSLASVSWTSLSLTLCGRP